MAAAVAFPAAPAADRTPAGGHTVQRGGSSPGPESAVAGYRAISPNNPAGLV
jgi:hypothetical protein